MKSNSLILSLLALFGFFFLQTLDARPREVETVRFRGVCQKCGHDLLAYYAPVECRGGHVAWQWVNEPHMHCQPAYQRPWRRDFFYSAMMNPANPRPQTSRGFRSPIYSSEIGCR